MRSRYGSHALACGAREGGGGHGIDRESVDTSPSEIAGLAPPSHGRPRPRAISEIARLNIPVEAESPRSAECCLAHPLPPEQPRASSRRTGYPSQAHRFSVSAIGDEHDRARVPYGIGTSCFNSSAQFTTTRIRGVVSWTTGA